MKVIKFIDLFAGIGGFHLAMNSLKEIESECVFASEIDTDASRVYEENFQMSVAGDITKIPESEIPNHDILFAGFPCQSFSKAGNQKGLDDTRGTLFFDIARILKSANPKMFVLENVRNLVSHDSGNTWQVIKKTLIGLGYRISEVPIILSPHYFGIPQSRERVFIVGIYDPKKSRQPISIQFPPFFKKRENSIFDILDSETKDDISESDSKILNIWNEFYQGINLKTIGFPIWLDYLNNETYDFNDEFPIWKKKIIERNRKLYIENKVFIDNWKEKHNNLIDYIPSKRKFEWQAGDDINSIWEGVIQFRPSGIRVKRPDVFPALVAMVHTPIIGKYKRYLTIREAGRLQSFPDDFIHHEDDKIALKQLGNAVNVVVTKTVIKQLLDYYIENYL